MNIRLNMIKRHKGSSIDSLQKWDITRRYKAFSHVLILSCLGLLASWAVFSTVVPGTDWHRMGGIQSMATTLARFLPPDINILPELVKPALETILIAVIGTIFGAVISLPIALLGAVNISPLGRLGYILARGLMTISRSIHEIIWALIFVSAVGLGSFAGILALAGRSIGFISKVISESIERIDGGPIEAISSVGGNKIHVILHGIFPQIMPITISTIIFEWDVNINRAAVLGLVGAGGLGLSFHNQFIASNFSGITTVLVVILFIILSGEAISAFLRKKLT